jgi:hypothetical protein
LTGIKTEGGRVRIRITKTPDASEFAEFDVRAFRAGETFDVAPHLGTLLILAGNAEPVPSAGDRGTAPDRPPRSTKGRKQLS